MFAVYTHPHASEPMAYAAEHLSRYFDGGFWADSSRLPLSSGLLGRAVIDMSNGKVLVADDQIHSLTNEEILAAAKRANQGRN